jgi:hypothetical protein
MGTTVASAARGQREPSTAHDVAERATAVDRYLAELRAAIDATGWTLDALQEHTGWNKGYLWRVLNNEKPFRLEHYVALPPDVHALFEGRRAEQRGFIVVEPPADEATARRELVRGLMGVLAASRALQKAGR